jgi:hypothetical protein
LKKKKFKKNLSQQLSTSCENEPTKAKSQQVGWLGPRQALVRSGYLPAGFFDNSVAD